MLLFFILVIFFKLLLSCLVNYKTHFLLDIESMRDGARLFHVLKILTVLLLEAVITTFIIVGYKSI